MKKSESARRQFVKLSTIGLGSLVLSPALRAAKKKSNYDPAINPPKTKINILCVGAHPGDPEFGCGGTMAKYSDSGHNVTFLYLTRGEAYKPNQSYAQSAEL